MKLDEITFCIVDCPHTTAKNEGQGFALIRTPNVGEGELMLNGVHRVSENIYNLRNARAVPTNGDIIYAREAPAGNAAVVRQEKVCLVQHVNLENIRPFKIPFPPLEEQERIVVKLKGFFKLLTNVSTGADILSSLIKTCKSKILDLAMQGKLVPQDPADEPAADMLLRINPKAKIITDNPHYPQLPDNWVLTTIGSICNYGDSENVSVEGIDASDWVLELEDIEKDSGNIVAQKPKEERTIKGIRHRFVKGDVLYSKLRTYLNKVLVAPADGYCTTEIIPIKTYDCVIPEYLCAWLRSPFFLSYTAECCYGVKMPRLSTSDARKGIIPLPPINIQRAIVEKLYEIFTVLDMISNSIS